jgi:hypothetical protein
MGTWYPHSCMCRGLGAQWDKALASEGQELRGKCASFHTPPEGPSWDLTYHTPVVAIHTHPCPALSPPCPSRLLPEVTHPDGFWHIILLELCLQGTRAIFLIFSYADGIPQRLLRKVCSQALNLTMGQAALELALTFGDRSFFVPLSCHSSHSYGVGGRWFSSRWAVFP